MRPDELDPDWVALVDLRAGRPHSHDGVVLSTLAEVMTLALPTPAQAAALDRLLNAYLALGGDPTDPGLEDLYELAATVARWPQDHHKYEHPKDVNRR